MDEIKTPQEVWLTATRPSGDDTAHAVKVEIFSVMEMPSGQVVINAKIIERTYEL